MMTNYHTDKWINDRVVEHLNDALEYFTWSHIVGIFLQGSQNYGLDYEGSDVDTKLIITPTFEEIAMNAKPHSTTFFRENEEHIDFKDIRLYMQTFRKQNLNFLEILFTPYKYINELYADWWKVLTDNREAIAHYNPYQAVKAMKGIALEKYFAMTHRYPSKIEIIDKYGYDPKQLHHLCRVDDYLTRYIAGDLYENCLRPDDPGWLMDLKCCPMPLEHAQKLADETKAHVEQMADYFCERTPNEGTAVVDVILDSVQLMIMEKSVKLDFGIKK